MVTPERLARPLEHRGADGFAGAHDAAQRKFVPIARARHGLHDHLERRREQKGVAHRIARHQRQRALGLEAAAKAHDRVAEIQRRQQRVHETAGPRPVGRRPEHIAFEREAVVRMHESRQVADQALMRHQRALGRAGGSAGVDQQRRVDAACRRWRESWRRPLEDVAPFQRPRAAGAGNADDVAQEPKSLTDRRNILDRGSVDEHDLGLGIVQPVFERVGTEQERQGHRDRAQLVAGDVRDRGLGPLRQDDRDLVAAAHIQRGERVGQPIGLLLHGEVRQRRRPAVLVLPMDRDPVRVAGMAPARGMGDVEVRGNAPAVLREELAIAVHRHARVSVGARSAAR